MCNVIFKAKSRAPVDGILKLRRYQYTVAYQLIGQILKKIEQSYQIVSEYNNYETKKKNWRKKNRIHFSSN